MKKSTVKALEGSIAKWEQIAAGKLEDKGVINCPLCQKFWSDGCEGCPVLEATGKWRCEGSPYEEWDSLMDNDGEEDADGFATTPQRKRVARRMRDFLKKLHPDYVKPVAKKAA